MKTNLLMEVTCTRCKRKTDTTEFPSYKVGVKCGYCGDGWLVTPSGSFQGQISYLKKAFAIASNQTVSVIVADDIDSASNFFENLIGEEVLQKNEIKQKYYQEITFTSFVPNDDGTEEEATADLADFVFSCQQDVLEVATMTMDEYEQRFLM